MHFKKYIVLQELERLSSLLFPGCEFKTIPLKYILKLYINPPNTFTPGNLLYTWKNPKTNIITTETADGHGFVACLYKTSLYQLVSKCIASVPSKEELLLKYTQLGMSVNRIHLALRCNCDMFLRRPQDNSTLIITKDDYDFFKLFQVCSHLDKKFSQRNIYLLFICIQRLYEADIFSENFTRILKSVFPHAVFSALQYKLDSSMELYRHGLMPYNLVLAEEKFAMFVRKSDNFPLPIGSIFSVMNTPFFVVRLVSSHRIINDDKIIMAFVYELGTKFGTSALRSKYFSRFSKYILENIGKSVALYQENGRFGCGSFVDITPKITTNFPIS